jgi:predicted O-linked N-acetylglucosamine transferase (SPINDLY family)
LDEAVECYERALAINPDLGPAHGNLLFALSYRRGTTLAGLAVAHRAWNDRFARPLKAKWPDHRPGRNRETPRLGFVSADFNNHPVGYFTIRVLEELRRKGVEFVCYANQTREDALTERFRAAAALWRPIAGLTDEAAAERIKADEIDVLFDMSGFMAGNRLPIFALKPAPVQVTWFGYMATTGLEAIDYILADGRHIPPASERYYSEKVVRLPHSLVCFDPPADAPAVTPLPALRNGFVTFGSFNVLCKITPAVVETWSRILRRVPNSRLLLKTAAFSCPTTRARYETLFASHGVAKQRLIFQGRTSRNAHMAATATVDIALDPFPYVGSTTTVECAFMGVPVITWPGELFSSRHSLSFLTTIGATETIVDGLKGYEDMAVALSQDLDRLGSMRASLRSRMLGSPLCDAASFTADFEEACLGMWKAFRGASAKK